jgi:hypothetical protein
MLSVYVLSLGRFLAEHGILWAICLSGLFLCLSFYIVEIWCGGVLVEIWCGGLQLLFILYEAQIEVLLVFQKLLIVQTVT